MRIPSLEAEYEVTEILHFPCDNELIEKYLAVVRNQLIPEAIQHLRKSSDKICIDEINIERDHVHLVVSDKHNETIRNMRRIKIDIESIKRKFGVGIKISYRKKKEELLEMEQCKGKLNLDESSKGSVDEFIESVKKLQKRMVHLYELAEKVLERHEFERIRISMTALEFELLHVIKNTIIRYIPKPLFINNDLRVDIEDLFNNVETDIAEDPLYVHAGLSMILCKLQ